MYDAIFDSTELTELSIILTELSIILISYTVKFQLKNYVKSESHV